MFKKGVEKRRSDRLMVTIPVRIQGKTKEGESFVREGTAIEVNRHGAQIQIEKPVTLGRQVRLTNLISSATGEFRVVRILDPSCAGGMDFAVEAIELNPTFWGIHFPSQPKKPLESRALLECCRCHTLSLLPISLTDVEILSSGGVLMKPCAVCTTRTPWGYSRKIVRGGETSDELRPMGENESISGPFAPGDGPQDDGALIQRPISLRTASGDVETVQTETASSGGISCTSEKNYEVDQEITLRWAHPASARNYEARGRVIRRLDIGGSKRKIYSIRYESSAILAETSSRKTPKLYLGFGLLLIAAAVLIEPNVRALTSSFFAHANTARQIAGLSAALLAVCLAYKTWKIILACEPEDRTVLKRRHRIAAGFAVALFCGALFMGISRGLGEARERTRAQTFLRDLTVARILEQNIDRTENRVLNAPSDYVDACSTLGLLVKRWMSQIGCLSADLAELRRSGAEQEARPAAGITCIQQVLSLDEQKAQLLQQQIDLQAQTKNIPPEKQSDYWKANFQPLRQKILNLDTQKENLLQSLVAEK